MSALAPEKPAAGADALSARCKPSDTASPPSTAPPRGFWAASLPLTGALVSAATHALYAACAGLLLAALFAHAANVRLSLSWPPRLLLTLAAPAYFPALLAANAAALAVLASLRGNVAALEAALARVAEAVASPLTRALPAARLGLPELRARLLAAGDGVAAAEGGGRGPTATVRSMLLRTALRAVVGALEMRYADALRRGGGYISAETVRAALGGEVAAAVLSPVTATLRVYEACVVTEAVALSGLPFLIAWLLSSSDST